MDRNDTDSLTVHTESSPVKRKAFSYWHQGITNAPEIVQTCITRLRQLNPAWEINVLDKGSVNDFVPRLEVSEKKLRKLNLPHRSDLIRTKLLIDHGGVWIDPTVYVTRPFDDWLPAMMQAGLFLYSRPGADRLISNWFISARPQHPILEALYRSLCEYWENNDFRNYERHAQGWESLLRRVINRNLDFPRLWLTWPMRKLARAVPYMVYHYMYYDLLCRRPDLKAIYAQMPVVPAAGPCRLQWRGLECRFDAEAKAILEDDELPLHKLTWKAKASEMQPDSIVNCLVRSQFPPAAETRQIKLLPGVPK